MAADSQVFSLAPSLSGFETLKNLLQADLATKRQDMARECVTKRCVQKDAL